MPDHDTAVDAGFARFEADLLAQGFDTVLRRLWNPLTVVGTHSHPFDAKAQVVQGEMWLTVGDETRHLQAGDGFELAAGIPHSERYGGQGAVFWVGRKSRPTASV